MWMDSVLGDCLKLVVTPMIHSEDDMSILPEWIVLWRHTWNLVLLEFEPIIQKWLTCDVETQWIRVGNRPKEQLILRWTNAQQVDQDSPKRQQPSWSWLALPQRYCIDFIHDWVGLIQLKMLRQIFGPKHFFWVNGISKSITRSNETKKLTKV